MIATVSYDKQPYVDSGFDAEHCFLGWTDISGRLSAEVDRAKTTICVECYPGVFETEIEKALVTGLRPAEVIRSRDCFMVSGEIDRVVAPLLGDDPVFGVMNDLEAENLFDRERLARLRDRIRNAKGLCLVLGTGASLVAPDADILVYADLPRWEAQQRQRLNAIANLGSENFGDSPGLKYKRAFFVD